MCHYITLVAPTDDAAALHDVMAAHGRRAIPIANPSVAKVLLADERQYLTYSKGCDCGTVLGFPNIERERLLQEELEHEEARLRRKRWPEAKIRRAMADKMRARERSSDKSTDSYELWEAVVRESLEKMNLPRIGLFVHSYRGSLVDETIDATRKELPPEASLMGELQAMIEDELVVFAAPR